MRKTLPAILLISILFVSLALRLWGSGFGLPYTRYHPDEHALVDRAAAILWTGDWNLHRFNYPPFYAYLQAGGYAAYFLYGAARGTWEQVMPFALPQYYQVGRWMTALAGTATVLVVYLAGRTLRRRRTGLLAAALLGGNYLHIIHSHYATFDVMVGLLVALTYLFSELLRTRRATRWYFLAGLCAGLAGATKYNGALVVLLPLLAHILATPWGEWGWLDGSLFVGVGGFLLGFFGGNPFALGNLPDFLNGLAQVLHHYGTEQPGFEGRGNWRWYLTAFFTSADALWFAVGLAGLPALLWKRWRKGLLLALFPILYFLLVSGFTVRFERNMVPLLPFLALSGGWLLDAGADWAARRLRRARLAPLLAATAAAVILALPLLAAVRFDAALSQPDLRQTAGQWVEEHIPPGSKIAIEHYAIPFDHDPYQVEDVIRLSDHDLDWYRQQGFEVVIVSDGVWPLLRQQAQFYAGPLAVYDDLAAHSTLLAEFVPDPPPLVVAGYPSVAVYHFAPVRIYRLEQE